jgi:hypothetical protein
MLDNPAFDHKITHESSIGNMTQDPFCINPEVSLILAPEPELKKRNTNLFSVDNKNPAVSILGD